MTNWQDFPKYALPPFTILDGDLELESDRLLWQKQLFSAISQLLHRHPASDTQHMQRNCTRWQRNCTYSTGSFISPPWLQSLNISPKNFSSTLLYCWIFLEITKDSKRFYDFPKNSISWKESILLMWGHLWQCIWLGEFNMFVSICIGMYFIGTFFFSCWFCWSSNAISSDLDMCHDVPQHNTRNTNYNSVSTFLTQLVSKGLFNSSLDRSLLSRIGACSVSKLPHWDVSVSADDQFRGEKRADL